MKIEYKVFRIILFLVLSVPFLFFACLLIKMEYDEYILYGDKGLAVITYKEGYNEPELAGGGVEYRLQMIECDKSYTARIPLQGGINPKKSHTQFTGHAKVGDTALVKVLSNIQVRVLEYKGKKINSEINLLSKVGKWLLIIFLLTMAGFLIYKIFKTIKIATTYD